MPLARLSQRRFEVVLPTMKSPLAICFVFSLIALIAANAQQVEAPTGRIEAYPAKQWTPAPADFLSTHWDDVKLKQAEEKWRQFHDSGQSTGLMIVHRGYVIREFGDCQTPIACHSVRHRDRLRKISHRDHERRSLNSALAI